MTAKTGASGRRVLIEAIREEPYIFAAAVAGSAVYGLMTVASAFILGAVTQRVVLPAFREGRASAGALAAGAAAIVAVAVLKVIGIIGRRMWAGIMTYRLQATFRRRVTRQYLRLPLAWHHRHPTGQLLSNAGADVETAWQVISPLPMAVGVVVMLLTSIGVMLATDLVLAGVGLLVFPTVALLNLAYQRRLSPLAIRAQQLRAEVSEVAHESFDGALVVKALGREDEETRRFRRHAEALCAANVAVGKVRGLFDPVLEALPTLGVLAVLLVGSMRVAGGRATTGEVVQVAYLFTLLAFPIRALGWVLGDLPRSAVGFDRVRAVLDARGAFPNGSAELPRTGAAGLRAEALRFSYCVDDESAAVLSDVSLDVAPGRTIAVVGPTGSGKSTLVSLLVRLVDPHSGAVLVDGVDARRIRRAGLTAAVAVVPQETFLFDDSVRGNLTLGLNASDTEIWQALRLAQAEGFVRALPRGLDTPIGERGVSLSGGQRQRIALARALLRQPRLLVLDDATSSVDPQVEARILAGLRDADLATTVIVVAYRNATIALADEVVYLEHGRVADRGRHAELMARCPGYQRLVTAYARAAAKRRGERDATDEEVVA